MSRFFYGKLAVSNLKKNKRLYLPYIFAAIGVASVYYIMTAIAGDEGINKMPGAGTLGMILELGCGVVLIFAVIFLFYTNSFLMKQRKKEFGLFHILGMEKRHIGKIMFWETCIISVLCIAGGAAAGVILYKLVVLVLLRATGLDVPFGFTISVSSVVNMAFCFLGIFVVTLLYNLFQIRKSKPIELLHSASQGEAEPKTKWLMTVLGLLALGGGYGIAIMVENPADALLLFFVAVLLVVLGTYCLFTAGSIAVLKMLRKNKKYYYRTRHFISVSGMIYRMKQNAVGLANICILSTMVLVMISGTVSLNAGIGDIIHNRYPRDVSITEYEFSEEEMSLVNEMIQQAAKENHLTIEELVEYTALPFAAVKSGENMSIVPTGTLVDGEISMLEIITLEEYNRMTGEQQELAEDEIFVSVRQGEEGDSVYNINGQVFRIKEYLKDLTLEGLDTNVVYDGYFIVVKDASVFDRLNAMQKEVYGDRASNVQHYIYMDFDGTDAQIRECVGRINQLREAYNQGEGAQNPLAMRLDYREAAKEDFMVLCGGFLFLGIFLGFVFLIATVLIIYYKQISEGYEDKERFGIMQKVGMSPREVKSSIHSQILKVFFLPLIMACIHLTAAFPMINRLLILFNLRNPGLFAICCVITVGVFAAIYGIVYGVTAKAYYKIVGEQR